MNEQVAITESQFVLNLKGSSLDDMMISIRAESAQLPSELISANVTILLLIPNITINSSGDNTAGGSYSLECSVIVIGSTLQPTVTWMDDGVEISSTDTTRTVSMTNHSFGGYFSTSLSFSPLRASDAGMFTCSATLEDAMNSQSFNVTVQGMCTYSV